MNNIVFIVISLLIIVYMFICIRNNKLDVKESFVWILFCIGLLILSIWPKALDWFADLLGISYPPALFLTIAVVILFMMNFIQQKKIVELQKKVTDLAQELSIVRNRNNEK